LRQKKFSIPVLTVLVVCKTFADLTPEGTSELDNRNSPKYKLIFFYPQTRAEAARMMFKLADVPFEDIRIFEDEWVELKPTTPFGQLPVLEFDGHKLAQSFAINRYLARKFGFAGNDPLEEAFVDSIADAFNDFFRETIKTVVAAANDDVEDKEAVYNETIVPAKEKLFPPLRQFLSKSNSGYVVGKSLTWADLMISNYFATCEAIFPHFFDGYTDIQNYVKHILNLPKIKQNTPEYKLIYFDVQMRAEPARMMFKLAGVPFEDVRISKQEWPQLKPTMPFGQVPVLEFDGHKLGQSFAINRFLARKFGFAGKDPLEQAYVDSIADGFKDFFEATGKTVLKVGTGEIQDKEAAYNETISPAREKFLPALRKFLKVSNSEYVVGNSLTWADLLISNYFATCQGMFPHFLDGYSDIDNYVKHILDLPKIKKWIAERPKSDFYKCTSYKLFYFNHRWRGEGARLIFAQANVPYDDVRVAAEEWINLKPSDIRRKFSVTPFGHLPVLEFDGNQLGESFAINRYLARQFGLAGNGSLESAYVDSIADAYKDFFEVTGKAVKAIAEGTSANKLRDEVAYTETIAPARDAFLRPLGQFLEKANSGYVVGNSVSWADLIITEYLATCQSLIPGFLDCCPNIEAYVKRIRNLPNIKKWIEERPKTDF
uniref:glutathione transferase n=1 Tax=Ascaris lumbricoides TaxID=6252 RepID=A0A9J2P7J0_ASCLU